VSITGTPASIQTAKNLITAKVTALQQQQAESDRLYNIANKLLFTLKIVHNITRRLLKLINEGTKLKLTHYHSKVKKNTIAC
jgi:hypothetical protein